MSNHCIVVECGEEQLIIASSLKHGYISLPYDITIDLGTVNVRSILMHSHESTLAVENSRVPVEHIWEELCSYIMRMIGIHEPGVNIHFILPTWVYGQQEAISQRAHNVAIAKVSTMTKCSAIAHAYSVGIPPQLASRVAIIERMEHRVFFTAIRRNGIQWQVGKSYEHRISQHADYTETLDWIFSLTDNLFGAEEGIILLDGSSEFMRVFTERTELMGKIIRVEQIDPYAVLERTVLEISSQSQQINTTDGALYSPEKTPTEIVSHHQPLIMESVTEKQHSRKKYAQIFIPLAVVAVLVALAVGGLYFVKSSRQGKKEEELPFTASSTATPSPQKTIGFHDITVVIPAGWERKEPPPTLKKSHKSLYIVHSTRPWEIVQIKFIDHPIHYTTIAAMVTRNPRLSQLEREHNRGEWKIYSYTERPSVSSSENAARVKWHILINNYATVQAGCIYAEHAAGHGDYSQECTRIVNSIQYR